MSDKKEIDNNITIETIEKYHLDKDNNTVIEKPVDKDEPVVEETPVDQHEPSDKVEPLITVEPSVTVEDVENETNDLSIEIGYSIYEIQYEEGGLFDISIDATYLIHTVGNGKLEGMIAELNTYKPTKKLYVILIQDPKLLKKKDNGSTLSYYFVDINLNIFRHAKQCNYDNILVLEDNCFFNPAIKEAENVLCLNDFLLNQKDNVLIYYLGCLPIYREKLSSISNHSYIYLCGSTHSIVYSKTSREMMLRVNSSTIKEMDSFLNLYHPFHKKRYLYKIPLCYQLFKNVEDGQFGWGVNYNNKHFHKILSIYGKYNISKFNLHKTPEPGFTTMYEKSEIKIPISKLPVDTFIQKLSGIFLK